MRCRRREGVRSSRRLIPGVVSKLAVYALAASSCLGVCVSAVQTDGATTYCLGLRTSGDTVRGSDSAGLRGSGGAEDALESSCPLALGLHVTSARAVQGVEMAAVALSVAVNHNEELDPDVATSCGLTAASGVPSVAVSIYYTDESEPTAIGTTSTSIENATLSNGTLSKWTSERVLVLQATAPLPSQSLNGTFVGRFTCGDGSSSVGPATRYDFAVYGKLNRSVAASSVVASEGGSISTVTLSYGQTLGLTGSQFTIAILVVVIVLICVAAAIVVWIRRRSRTRLKVQQGPASPVTGESNLRFSDWTQVYATNDSLPSSILLDDCTTLAILRASVVSPKRHVADFTRDVAMWDERSSASPITPGSCILASDSSASLSPANSFVLMESSDRVSLPLQEALQSISDSEDERLEVEV